MRIVTKKGLDIPLGAKPEIMRGSLKKPRFIALNVDPFEEVRFKLLVQRGDRVKIGTPLLENKNIPGQFFVAPAAGVVTDVQRGLKRRLHNVVIEVDAEESYQENGGFSLENASYEALVDYLMRGGIFPHIRMRPFDFIANPQYKPRDIFISALESLPYAPPSSMQVAGEEANFQVGLEALQKLTSGQVHLVYEENTPCRAFVEATGVVKHTASGPHPISSSSLHIQRIKPILRADDYVWTLSTSDVIAVGKMVAEGKYYTKRVLSLAGEGVSAEGRGFYEGRLGYPVEPFLEGKTENVPKRLISGDPLVGSSVEKRGFLHFFHLTLTAIPEQESREPFHFFRLGKKKYSVHKAYFSGHVEPPKEGYDFSTSLHGEPRAIIDGAVYDQFMPLHLPTASLIKAILAEDFDLATQLGLLEVAPEDFAIPTFICPSKTEMVSIVRDGLKKFAKEMGLPS